MDRRSVLSGFAGALAGLAGCTSNSSENTGDPAIRETTSTRITTTTKMTSTSTDTGSEPTVRETTTASAKVEKQLAFGDWWTDNDFGYTVTGIEASTTFYDTFEKRKEIEMPSGKKLLFADLKIKNISQEEQYQPYADPFGAVSSDNYFSAAGSFEHPEYDTKYGVDMDWFRRAERKPRLQGSINQEIASGAVEKVWLGFVVPRDLSTSRVGIGYDTYGQGKYEIRWTQQ